MLLERPFINEPIKSPENLADRLKSEGIHVVLRKSEDGHLFGITYVDHKTQCIFNESSLGKQYSAKRILERCEQSVTYNQKQYQRSISPHSENTQNLEYNEY